MLYGVALSQVLEQLRQMYHCILQSTSGRSNIHDYDTAFGIAANSQPVMGVPSDIPHVMHPGGQRTPAMVIGVSADCKVSIYASNTSLCTAPHLHCIMLSTQGRVVMGLLGVCRSASAVSHTP